MRIIQLVTRRQRRGAEVFAADLARALVERGHEVAYVGLAAPAEEPVHPRGTEVLDLSSRPVSLIRFLTVLRLARYLRQTFPHVVQANGGYAMKCAVLARRLGLRDWPLVYCNIGLSSDWLRRPGQRAWNRWLLRQVTVTAAVSETTRRDLIETYGLDPGRVEVVRRGVDTGAVESREDGRRALRESGVPGDGEVLLHVGSLSPEKNHQGLLRIFERVRARRSNACLVLVGDGPIGARLKEAATRLPGVFILGLRSDVLPLMAGADLLLLPSHTEGIPGAVLEAGIQSLPTVAYAVGGVGEAIVDGKTGCLLARGNEEGFAQVVLKLLDDPGRRHALGEGAAALVRSRYSLEKSVDAFERLYLRLL